MQTNSATSEEGATASEELSSQAEMLKQMVDDIKLKDIKDMKFTNLNKLSPDIIREIEDIIERNKKVQESEIQDKDDNTREKEVVVSSGNPQILLDDTEFGKY